MKKQKKFKNFNKHLRNYVMLTLLTSLAIIIFSAVLLIFNDPTGVFPFELPIAVHYLGLFVSSMMMIMGMYYFRALKNRK
jgi:uncharacterized membrane protein